MRGDAAEASLLTRAAAFVRSLQIDSDADLGPLFDAAPPSDADPEMLKRLRQMYEAGGWVLVESAVADLPADLRWLYESDAVTLDQLAALHQATGITNAADLAAVLADDRRTLAGILDEATSARIGAALPALRARVPRVPLGRAFALADPYLAALRASTAVAWAEPVGSLRRGSDSVGDIELLAATARPEAVLRELQDVAAAAHVLHRSPQRLYVLTDRTQIGVRLADPATAGAALLQQTGSPAHLAALREHARSRGVVLTAGGIRAHGEAVQAAASEDDIYAALGLPSIPPEIREDGSEVAAAARGTVPALVTRAHIRGDLHMHSLWSDGRDPIEAMVQGCRALGYEYIAITDHSPHSAAVRNLTVGGVSQQAEEIAALRERFSDITILHGCEADILPDGRLDFPERVLEGFDIVLASLHEAAGHSPEQLMSRYELAMRHPLVTLITHPTNRLVPHRPGYPLDYDCLFALAAETRTAVEIDGAPGHLDLDGALARRAVAAGAMVAIDSDCHRAEMLERQMMFGLMTARRGWIEPKHVLHTRPLGELRALIAAKRGTR